MISGIILAGGKSSRMKFNKAFARLHNQTVIEILVKKFTQFFSETIIISNDPELFTEMGVRVFQDIIPSQGPVSGIHAGLNYANHETVFICGCDMPFVNLDMVDYLMSRLGNHDSVVPEIHGHLQPTAAIYNRKCLPVFTESLQQDHLKLTWLFREELDAVVVQAQELERFGDVSQMFFNINDANALEKARKFAW
ncbi:MAG TPA: molybdenum cofactor guanylyltransferase [Syntrophomonadaceae bacterium]|nr:molybdenum cofactor guanylyltransferase [Syntrophomonadaceae bacterium]